MGENRQDMEPGEKTAGTPLLGILLAADEILGINTDARQLGLSGRVLVALLASIVAVVNAFRMMRLPDPAPSAATEGMVLG
jgi:hypothetical protein